MSASREKKQRQAAGSNLSPKAQEERKKQQQRKRNTIVYTVIGVVFAVLVAALLIWNSGIIQRNATPATIGGEKVTPAQIVYYYYNNEIILTAQAYTQYGMAFPYYSLSQSPKDQVIDAETASALGMENKYVGQTFHDYFLDSALQSLQKERALCAAAKAAGYTLSEEGKAAVQSQMDSIDAYREQLMVSYGHELSRTAYLQQTACSFPQTYGNLMTESDYLACLENQKLASEYYTQGADVLFSFSEDELNRYYEDNKDTLDTFTYYYRTFSGTASGTTDADGNYVAATEEEQAAALAAAEADANAARDAVQGKLNSVQNDSNYTLQSGMLSPASVIYDWMTDPARKSGDAAVFEGSYNNFNVFVYAGRELDTSPTADVRHILVSAMPEDDPATEDVNESTQAPTQADFDAAKAEAERIQAEWEAAGKTEEAFAALAEQYSADPGSNTNGGLYEKVTQGQMIAEFNDWVFAAGRKSGDVGFAQNTQSSIQGWHLIYYVGDNLPAWQLSAGEGLWLDSLDTTFEIVRKGALDSIFD